MRDFWVGIHTFLSRNTAIIVSTCSLFVACLSLYFTIHAQDRDAFYKELGVQPVFQFESYVVDFSFNLVNQGLGVGQIQRLSFELDGKCRSSDEDGSAYDKALNEFLDKTAFIDYMDAVLPDIGDQTVRLSTGVVSIGTLIRPGQSIKLFFFEPDQLDKVAKLGGTSTKARNSWIEKMAKLPMRYEYCSLSGLFCSAVTTQNTSCP